MTDSQVKYQTLMENQRHNLEMERLGAGELLVKQQDSSTKAGQLDLANRQLAWDIQLADYSEPAQRAQRIGSAFAAFGKGFKDIIGGVTGIGALFG